MLRWLSQILLGSLLTKAFLLKAKGLSFFSSFVNQTNNKRTIWNFADLLVPQTKYSSLLKKRPPIAVEAHSQSSDSITQLALAHSLPAPGLTPPRDPNHSKIRQINSKFSENLNIQLESVLFCLPSFSFVSLMNLKFPYLA